jgi:hypothetical protein
MPATVTSRPMPARSSRLAGITIRPCLSSSASGATRRRAAASCVASR